MANREYYNGKDTYLIYAEDTAWDTAGTPSVSNTFGRVQSISLNMNNNLIRTQGCGEGANATNTALGNFDVNGSFTTKPIDFDFLQYGVGDVTGAGTDGSPYILTEQDNIGYGAGLTPSITLEIGNKGISNNQTKVVNGVIYNSWTLTGTQGQELTCTVNWVGQDIVRGTTIETYSAPSGRTYVFNSGSLIWGSGSDDLSVTDFSITCSKNTVNPREINSRFIKQGVFGVRRYDWTFTLNYYYDSTTNIKSATELLDEFFQKANEPESEGAITGDDIVLTISEGSAVGDKVAILKFEDSFINDWAENPSVEGGVISISINGFSQAGESNVPISWHTID